MDDRDVDWQDLMNLEEEIAGLTRQLAEIAARQQALRAQYAISQGRTALKRDDYDGVVAAFKRFIGSDDREVTA